MDALYQKQKAIIKQKNIEYNQNIAPKICYMLIKMGKSYIQWWKKKRTNL